MNTADSNKQGDMQARLLCAALLCGSLLLFGSGLFWGVTNLATTLARPPIDWIGVVLLVAGMVIMLLVARSLVWMSFFGAIMFATRVKAWKSQESLCRAALYLRKIIPGGASTAALVLAQNLLGQTKTDDAIKIAEEQWQRSGSEPRADQNLALLCATAGVALQMRGDVRESIAWNERAIDAFKLVLDQAAHPKGWISKLAASQSGQWIPTVHMHLSVVYLHNANSHFSKMNHRPAKENYKRAVEHANQAPESAEKKEVLQVGREQLSRLKHA